MALIGSASLILQSLSADNRVLFNRQVTMTNIAGITSTLVDDVQVLLIGINIDVPAAAYGLFIYNDDAVANLEITGANAGFNGTVTLAPHSALLLFNSKTTVFGQLQVVSDVNNSKMTYAWWL